MFYYKTGTDWYINVDQIAFKIINDNYKATINIQPINRAGYIALKTNVYIAG